MNILKPTNEWFSGAELGAGLMDQGKEKGTTDY